MSATVRFRQSEIERAARALKAVGETIMGVEIKPDGSFMVLTAANAPEQALSPLEAWEREHGSRAA